MAKKGSVEATIRDIKRKTRRKYNAEEKGRRDVVNSLDRKRFLQQPIRRERARVNP
jgi:hypothetical protein